jgi:hypothetical protein
MCFYVYVIFHSISNAQATGNALEVCKRSVRQPHLDYIEHRIDTDIKHEDQRVKLDFCIHCIPVNCVYPHDWSRAGLCAPWPLFQFLNLYTVGRTPWTGDQPVARPLPTHRTTQTEQTHTDIHALSGIRTHDYSVRTGEDGSCLRPRGHCDRQSSYYPGNITTTLHPSFNYVPNGTFHIITSVTYSRFQICLISRNVCCSKNYSQQRSCTLRGLQ